MENLNLSYKHDIQEINELSHDDFFKTLSRKVCKLKSLRLEFFIT